MGLPCKNVIESMTGCLGEVRAAGTHSDQKVVVKEAAQ